MQYIDEYIEGTDERLEITECFKEDFEAGLMFLHINVSIECEKKAIPIGHIQEKTAASYYLVFMGDIFCIENTLTEVIEDKTKISNNVLYFKANSIITIRTKRKWEDLNAYFIKHLTEVFSDSDDPNSLSEGKIMKIDRPITKGKIKFKLNCYHHLDSWDIIEGYLSDSNIDYAPEKWFTKTYLGVYSFFIRVGQQI
jgi:hypothetical protein